MEYKIIDNFLEEEQFEEIKNEIIGPNFHWNMNPCVSNLEEMYEYDPNTIVSSYYFTNTLFSSTDLIVKPRCLLFESFVNKLEMKSLIRIKANLYPSTKKIMHHKKHTDFPFSHRGAIFYLNTNNGLTVLEDGTEVQSIKNRLLLFDPSKIHNSTTCTDQKCRINVNFNFF